MGEVEDAGMANTAHIYIPSNQQLHFAFQKYWPIIKIAEDWPLREKYENCNKLDCSASDVALSLLQ